VHLHRDDEGEKKVSDQCDFSSAGGGKGTNTAGNYSDAEPEKGSDAFDASLSKKKEMLVSAVFLLRGEDGGVPGCA